MVMPRYFIVRFFLIIFRIRILEIFKIILGARGINIIVVLPGLNLGFIFLHHIIYVNIVIVVNAFSVAIFLLERVNALFSYSIRNDVQKVNCLRLQWMFSSSCIQSAELQKIILSRGPKLESCRHPYLYYLLF